jgi:2-phosphosulfolactate phosphatase
VVIDALRASATIVAALGSGMASVKPVTSAEECVGDVTAGERGGRKLPNLDHANSPTELLAAGYRGRSLVLTTTNGTECLKAAKSDGNLVLVGTTLNARAVAGEALKHALATGGAVTLLMCGRNNQPCVEDELAAAEILSAMGPTARLRGAAPHSSTALEAEFFAGESGQNLVNLGYADDVRFCARLDEYSVVPVFRDGIIVPLEQ